MEHGAWTLSEIYNRHDMENVLNHPSVDTASLPDVQFDGNGKPAGITPDEWIDRLDRKLTDHYGPDFRQLLNESRAARGQQPLS
jgi:hypothetical protein